MSIALINCCVFHWIHLTGGFEDLAPEDRLPVMFFVYGGGYTGGSMIKMDQARLGDVADFVLVTVNYRLGPLGKAINAIRTAINKK